MTRRKSLHRSPYFDVDACAEVLDAEGSEGYTESVAHQFLIRETVTHTEEAVYCCTPWQVMNNANAV